MNCHIKIEITSFHGNQCTKYGSGLHGDFLLQSRQAMEDWVNGLREAKEFWIRHYKRQAFKKQFINQGNFTDVSGPVYDKDESQVSFQDS